MSEKKTCKYYQYATYSTCSSCKLDGNYTNCYGNINKCKHTTNRSKPCQLKKYI